MLVSSIKCTNYIRKRALATSVLVGANIIGSGIGFAIPTVVVA
jgi:hypothetical protein